MESSVAPLPHQRLHLPNRTNRFLFHHLCSSFDLENQISLTTPAVLLQELALRTETLETKAEKMEKSLMLGDVFDGIDLQDTSVRDQHKDFFDEFELIINQSEDFAPEGCVNLFEALDVNDYGDDGMAKQASDLVQSDAENLGIATELQVGSVEGDKKVSEFIGSETEEVCKLVESNEVVNSGVLETSNEEMEVEKHVTSSQVLADSILQMVEEDDVEEGEISGDDNDNMLIGDDLPVERHEESHVSQEVLDKRGEGTSKSTCSGVEVLNVDNRVKENDQTSKNQEKMDSGTCIKKKYARSKEAKARKKAKDRKKRAQERISLGVKKLKLKPVAPKSKPIRYCRHYLKGRCQEGEQCKFSHDTIPETKSLPCCYFATQSCMKGDDCPYDHDLSKYPCTNFITKGFCHRGGNCLFSHKGTPQSASDTPSANVTTSSNNQSVREAIAKLPAIQARVSSSAAFLKPSSQSNKRNSSDASSSKHATPLQIPPLRKQSVAPKGMSFLSLDKTLQEEDSVKPSLGSKQNTQSSDSQSLNQSQQRSSVSLVPPKGISFLSFASEEPASSRYLKTTPNSHIQSSLNSAMKLAAEFESAKVARRANDPPETVNNGGARVNTSVTKNSGNISSKILKFLSSFSTN